MRAIFFDFGGTLDWPRHWLDRFVTHYRAAGLEIDRTELERAFSAATHAAYGRSTLLRNYSLSQLASFLVELQFESLASQSGGTVSYLLAHGSSDGITKLKTQIRDSFVAESMIGLGASRPLLASLARNFKIGVVSNFYGNLDRVIAEADLSRAVTATVDSGLLGFYKPDPRIFSASLEQLGVQAHHAVMIGDSISKDCAPAHALGMTTIWLRHRELNEDGANAFPASDFIIDQLDDLKGFRWLAG
jgi:FMN phosphatase YigB (HAD superfamily)